MRAALVAVAVLLYAMSEFDEGLLQVDNVLGPTAASTLVDPKHLAVWLRRVTESWENTCVEFRQAGADMPKSARCVREHEQYLNWKSATATVKEELRAEFQAHTTRQGQSRGKGKGGEPAAEGEVQAVGAAGRGSNTRRVKGAHRPRERRRAQLSQTGRRGRPPGQTSRGLTQSSSRR